MLLTERHITESGMMVAGENAVQATPKEQILVETLR